MNKDVSKVLNHTESMIVPLSHDGLSDLQATLMVDLDVEDLSSAMFQFMNSVLEGDAFKALDATQDANGLEVWRKVTKQLTEKSPDRRQALINSLTTIMPAKAIEDVPANIQEWGRWLREYHKGRWRRTVHAGNAD